MEYKEDTCYRQININGDFVAEHRYLMEQKLNRKLTNDELVHHINGDSSDNRIENLRIVSRKEHAFLHQNHKDNRKPVAYKVDEDVLKEFNEKAKEKAINKSQWLENRMKEFIKEANKNGN